MLNYIWLGLMVCAVLIGGLNGQLKEVTDRCLEMANPAVVGIAFALISVMALWLGVMRLAERAGLVALLARILRPSMIRIFPEMPAEHPAMGSMLMNIAANLLGLGHAATPLSLRAMRDLESLNHRDECHVHFSGDQHQRDSACSRHGHRHSRGQPLHESHGHCRHFHHLHDMRLLFRCSDGQIFEPAANVPAGRFGARRPPLRRVAAGRKAG